MAGLSHLIRTHRTDTAMTMMVFVWGFNFIVLKDAVTNVAPLTFNALRFMVGLPVITLLMLRDRPLLRLSWRDFGLIVLLTLSGPTIYQVGFVLGIKRTTSTNAALLVATMPTWTATFSLMLRLVEVRRRLLAGIALTLAGVALVVIGRSESGLALSHDNLIGSALVLGAAMVNGLSNIVNKPVVDRLGGMRVAVWKYWCTAVSLVLIAAPGLLTLSAGDIPLHSVPNVFYSGLTSVGGFVVVHYALHEIGPTRTASYFNFNPIIAAFAGIVILGEPLTTALLLGGCLTLFGVLQVRNNIYLRRRSTLQPALESAPGPLPGPRAAH